ncbi:MAG: DUF4402 domain-containing protein [Alphaproteobacteria bacterium]|nr:DUF4402 domain-containing protein [Alphaproteobacteria bacterium]
MKRFAAIILVLTAVHFPYGDACAQTMTEVQNLDFGTFGLRDNDAGHTIVVEPDGDVTYAPEIVPGMSVAQRGEYALTGFPANMLLTFGVASSTPPDDGGIIVDNGTSLSTGSGEVFTVDTYTTNSPTTDGSGDATLYLGATLTTSGSTTMYGDGLHSGNVDITIYFE